MYIQEADAIIGTHLQYDATSKNTLEFNQYLSKHKSQQILNIIIYDKPYGGRVFAELLHLVA